MNQTKTLFQVVDEMTADGFDDVFRAEGEGDQPGLRAVNAGCFHATSELCIERVARFEGATNPDDEAVVFALRCEPHSVRGTYTVPYGPSLGALDARIVQELSKARQSMADR